ncbi:MAG: hypothetical protein QW728_04550, partial [Thermoplasmata archaeon]
EQHCGRVLIKTSAQQGIRKSVSERGLSKSKAEEIAAGEGGIGKKAINISGKVGSSSDSPAQARSRTSVQSKVSKAEHPLAQYHARKTGLNTAGRSPAARKPSRPLPPTSQPPQGKVVEEYRLPSSDGSSPQSGEQHGNPRRKRSSH